MENDRAANQILQQCVWPDLAEPYASAVKEAVQFILAHFDIFAIVVSGTIIRGQPDKSSDLDILVLHGQPIRQRIQKRFHGVPTEIFVNPPHAFDRYFAQERVRPVMAHMLMTGFIIIARDPTIYRLREQATASLCHGPSYTDADLTRSRYAAATWYEDALDVVERDPATAQMLLSHAVYEMLQFSVRQRQMYIPRHKELLDCVAQSDAELGLWARTFFQSTSLSQRLELAEQIADRTIQQRGFFEWASEPESMEPTQK